MSHFPNLRLATLLLIPASLPLLGACRSHTEASESAMLDQDSAAPASAEDMPDAEVVEEEATYQWPHEMIEGEPMFKLMEHDDLPAIDAPVFVDVDAADAFMDMDETVLGVVGKNGTAKCYSAWQLDSHEIVNDQLDGEAIAATW